MTTGASLGVASFSRAALVRFWRQAPASFRIGGTILAFHIVVAITGPLWAPYGQAELFVGPALAAPGWDHPFGTDVLGRDVFSRVVHGAHLVIVLSVLGTLIGVVVGTTIGLLSAYLRGWFDTLVMHLIETLISIPYLVLALLAVAAAGPEYAGDPVLLVLVVGFVFSPRVARIARASGLDLVTRDFVTIARLRGESPWSVVVRELLPNATGTLLVEFALRTGYAPVLIGTLGFLGFGLRPPSPEWGLMISEYRNLLLASPIVVLMPGLMLASLIIGFNMWTEGLARILGRSVRFDE